MAENADWQPSNKAKCENGNDTQIFIQEHKFIFIATKNPSLFLFGYVRFFFFSFYFHSIALFSKFSHMEPPSHNAVACDLKQPYTEFILFNWLRWNKHVLSHCDHMCQAIEQHAELLCHSNVLFSLYSTQKSSHQNIMCTVYTKHKFIIIIKFGCYFYQPCFIFE